MKIESVANAVIEEAEKEANAIRQAAEKEASAAIKVERERLAKEKESRLKEYEKEISKMMDERIAAARLDAKKELQKAEDAVAQRVIESALDQLYNMRKSKTQYAKVLKKLYARARSELGSGKLEVLCAKADTALMEEIAEKGDSVKADASVDGGIIVRDPGKNVLIDLTFTTLVKDKEADIKVYVYKKLFR